MEQRVTANIYRRRIVLCGDDFGMAADIDRAIFLLAEHGRLSAVSAMPFGVSFAAHAAVLAGMPVDVGLHLNLSQRLCTEDGIMPSLSSLLWRAYTGHVDTHWVRSQIVRQLDAFEAQLGRAPDYIDGHQHVHQLPGVRECLLTELQHRYTGHRPWLRSTVAGGLQGIPWKDTCKARLIAALGARRFVATARRGGWTSNRGFLGVYAFQGGQRGYAHLLHHWLTNALDGDLLMCHPAMPQAHAIEHAQQRGDEFTVLSSAELGNWLSVNGVAVTRMSQIKVCNVIAPGFSQGCSNSCATG